MSRCIDADALEELFREVIGGIAKKPEMNGNLEHMVRASAMVIEMIQDAPTIEPQRKKGEWIPQNLNKSDGMISTAVYYYPKCSVCGASANYTNFCPNCGARMEDE